MLVSQVNIATYFPVCILNCQQQPSLLICIYKHKLIIWEWIIARCWVQLQYYNIV